MESLRVRCNKYKNRFDEIVVSVRGLQMTKRGESNVHAAQLLEELLLLLTVGHGEVLETAGQTLLHVLEDARFGII